MLCLKCKTDVAVLVEVRVWRRHGQTINTVFDTTENSTSFKVLEQASGSGSA
ncbi:hypothetical protein ACHAC9_02410 [Massilia sp. CMS3.1]|uniref:hypothetical protein n=1 Tax=Massilia sp. CMS3.1 TaxID=3373083 RepID=UPI003EE68426